MRYLGCLLLLSTLMFSCDRTDSSLKGELGREAMLQERADEIHEQLARELRAKYPADEGSIWAETSMALDDDWIVQSPEELWGVDSEFLEIPLDCDLKSEKCEPTFRRNYCETDNDCSAVSRCEVMDALVFSPGDVAPSLCIGRADRLINRMYNVMVSADSELDFASLSLPTGRLRLAAVNALAFLAQKPSVPQVRLLFSGATSALPEILHPARKGLNDLMAEVEAKTSLAYKLHVNLAWLSVKPFSWNHAKIIVADGDRALSGGHNLWDEDYLGNSPVFDLSMEYRGDGASVSREYLNALWSKAKNVAVYPKGSERIADFELESHTQGDVRALSVGRMGALGSNPSDTALKSLIDSAKQLIVISQQDLYNQLVTPLTKTYVFDNIVTAAARGVQIQIVKSNSKLLLGGYGSVDSRLAYKNLIESLTSRLMIMGSSKAEAKEKACDTIKLASFHFSEHVEKWPFKNSAIVNHTKMLMVDDAAFYIGSHNLYPANLQEFGLIVTDPKAVAELKAQYWDKVWAASGPGAYDCPR